MKDDSIAKKTGLERNLGMIDLNPSVSRRRTLGIVAAAVMAPVVSATAQTSGIRVHKDPKCGCCSGWVRYTKAAGFGVTVRNSNLQQVKRRLGVPAYLAACHTAEAVAGACEHCGEICRRRARRTGRTPATI